MSKPSKSPGQYVVGYGRPPVHSQFKPGQSGYPAGRTKGQPTANEIFMKEAARLVKVKRGETVETITKFEAMIRKLLQSAMEGDIPASRLVLIGLSQSAPSATDAPARTRPRISPSASRRTTRRCGGCWRASPTCRRRGRRLTHERG